MSIVAIVGRPNVGKSTLFNRLVGMRKAIVDDTAGTTRDRHYGTSDWNGREFSVIDTGGYALGGEDVFEEEIRKQVLLAIDESDVVIFMVEVATGITDLDMVVADLLRRSAKKVLLVVNKVDNNDQIYGSHEFYALGLSEPIAVSGSHGIGIGDVMDALVEAFPEKQQSELEGIRFAVIGRPNVGKSSLVNALLKEERVIVSDIEGTTRDAIDTPFEQDGKHYVVVDTAGIRKRGKVYENIEKYSVLRAMSAIERCDVVLFVIDGESGIREQDKHVAGYAHEAGKPIIIVYNKWDAVEKDEKTMNRVTEQIRTQFVYLSYAPILFVSAKTHQRVNTLLPMIEDVYHYSQLRIATNVLNEVVMDAQLTTPAPTHNGQRLKILYASQVAVAPPTFVLFVNDPQLLHFSYRRYIENRLREAFGFDGSPIRIIARSKD